MQLKMGILFKITLIQLWEAEHHQVQNLILIQNRICGKLIKHFHKTLKMQSQMLGCDQVTLWSAKQNHSMHKAMVSKISSVSLSNKAPSIAINGETRQNQMPKADLFRRMASVESQHKQRTNTGTIQSKTPPRCSINHFSSSNHRGIKARLLTSSRTNSRNYPRVNSANNQQLISANSRDSLRTNTRNPTTRTKVAMDSRTCMASKMTRTAM